MNMQTNSEFSERDTVLAAWEAAKVTLETAKADEMEKRKAATDILFPDAKEGTNKVPLANGFQAKMVRKINYKLDNDNAKINSIYDAICGTGNEGSFLAERILKRVYDFGASEYKKLVLNNPTHKAVKDLVDTILTTSDGAPSLEIVAPKEGK